MMDLTATVIIVIHCHLHSTYLGIYFDDELNWQTHIDHIYNKIIKFTGILYKLRSKLEYESNLFCLCLSILIIWH